MTLDEFRECPSEPSGLTPPLRALWYDARNDWQTAHQVAQDGDSSASAWVHAYLHRREGDISNARYWYARAGRPEHRGSLESEWTAIVSALLPAGDLA